MTAIADALIHAPVPKSRGYWASVAIRLSRDPVAMVALAVVLAHRAGGGLRAADRARRSAQGVDDPAAAPDRVSRLSARLGRARARHAHAPDLRRPAVALHRRHPGAVRFRDRFRHRHLRGISRRLGQHHADARHRCVLCVSVGAARDRTFGRARRRNSQLDRLAHDRLRAADCARRRERHHPDSHPRLRRGRARFRRRGRSRSSAFTCSATYWGRFSSMRPA